MTGPAFADIKATVTAQWARAAGSDRPGHAADATPDPAPLIEHLVDAPAPPGFSVWSVNSSAPIVLPTLALDAPIEIRLRYFARLLALATGTCPLCGAVATLGPTDPEHSRPAAWAVLPLTFVCNKAPLKNNTAQYSLNTCINTMLFPWNV